MGGGNGARSARDEVLHALQAHERFFLTTHEKPDGDAVGSLSGMQQVLTAAGKDAVAFLAEDELPLSGQLDKQQAIPMSPLLGRKTTLKDALAMMIEADVQAGVVVDKDGKAEYRSVKLGPLDDGLRIVREGLKPGEKIVVNGLQRVRPGAPIAAQVVPMVATAAPAPATPAAATGA